MISSLGIHVIHDEFTFTLRESTDLRESIWLGTTKIDLRENLSYFGNFLLNRTSEKCHTQQLQTHHALRSSQPLQSCPRSHARPARLHTIHAKSEGSTSMARVVSEVSYDLRKAKLAWMSAYGSTETKQTCMRDFL